VASEYHRDHAIPERERRPCDPARIDARAPTTTPYDDDDDYDDPRVRRDRGTKIAEYDRPRPRTNRDGRRRRRLGLAGPLTDDGDGPSHSPYAVGRASPTGRSGR